MFIDVAQYPCLRDIMRNTSVISDELEVALKMYPEIRDALLSEGRMDFPSNEWTWDNEINTASLGYDLRDGSYAVYSLYKPGHTLELASRAFKNTLALTRCIKQIHYICISALGGGAHLGLHTHNRPNHIFHLLLNDLDKQGCEMICDGHKKILKKAGDTALFDYRLPHETYSRSSNIRFNLMVDFFPGA